MKLNFENNFETNVTTDASAGATTTYLDDIPSVPAPFYLTFDPLNANGHYEEVLVTSKTATSVSHAATTYAHAASETVRMTATASALDLFAEQSSTGWTPAGDGETWVYASATSFTIAGVDKTDKYQKGDKIKLTNDGSTKYFYITDVSFSTDTTVTITGGSDYSLVSGDITNPYYSKVENPLGFPHWFNYSPSYSALNLMTYTSVTTNLAKFRIVGKECLVLISASGTTGGTASNTVFASTPITPASLSTYQRGGAATTDAGTLVSGFFYVDTANSNIGFRRYDAADYGLGTVGIQAEVIFSI